MKNMHVKGWWLLLGGLLFINPLMGQKISGDLQRKADMLQYIRTMSKKQVQEIANYEALSPQQQKHYRQRIEYWLTRIYKLTEDQPEEALPESIYDIYAGLIYVGKDPKSVKLIRNWNIAYVPGVNFYYQIYYHYYKAYLKYGADTPLPEVIMGIMNVESHFRWIKGDNQQSIGPCQLNRSTARWLLENSKTRKVFQNYIYFDRPNEQGNHHFYNQEAMVAFLYEFLVRIKGYRRGSELNAIATYNGSSVWDHYSRQVKKATASFIAFKRLFHNRNVQPGEYAASRIRTIRQNYYERIFPRDRHGQPYLAYHYATEGHFREAPGKRKPARRKHILPKEHFAAHYSADKHAVYLLKSEEHSLFSYFRGHLPDAVKYHNRFVAARKSKEPEFSTPLDDDFIYLYYYTHEGGEQKQRFIRSKKAYKQAAASHKIRTNFDRGKIYLNPSIPVFCKGTQGKPVCRLEELP